MEMYSLTAAHLDELLLRCRQNGQTVFVPQRQQQQVSFKPMQGIRDITRDYIQTTKSAKEVIFPPVEKLLGYRRDGGEMKVMERDLASLPRIVLFGVRPCDAAAIGSLRAVFTWDEQDSLFKKRLENTTVITMACTQSDADCFCTSTGTGPDDTRGSDIVLTPLPGGDYLAEVITDKGQRLQAESKELWGTSPNVNKKELLAKVEIKFEPADFTKKLEGSFEHPVWKENSMRCLGCAACAYVCPVCSCFDIQDEGTQHQGNRLRCWDACGFQLFTLHTSGHNPREVQPERWRQRLLHKFSYMPERLSVYGCVGCGRCSRACPADMNMIEQIEQVVSSF